VSSRRRLHGRFLRLFARRGGRWGLGAGRSRSTSRIGCCQSIRRAPGARSGGARAVRVRLPALAYLRSSRGSPSSWACRARRPEVEALYESGRRWPRPRAARPLSWAGLATSLPTVLAVAREAAAGLRAAHAPVATRAAGRACDSRQARLRERRRQWIRRQPRGVSRLLTRYGAPRYGAPQRTNVRLANEFHGVKSPSA